MKYRTMDPAMLGQYGAANKTNQRRWIGQHANPVAQLAAVSARCLLLSGSLLASGAWAANAAVAAADTSRTVAPLYASLAAHPESQVAPQASTTRFTLREFVSKALASNQSVLSKRNEKVLADAAVLRASGAFQPVLGVSAINSRSAMQNTPEEKLLRQGLGIYDRSGQDYSATVSTLLPTGAKVEAKATMSRFLTNITQNLRGGDAQDYRAFYGLSLTQPLARDAGIDITNSRIRMAELDLIAATESTRGTEAGMVAEAIFSYLDMRLAHARLDAAREKIAMAERLLAQARALRGGGRMADPDVAEVENNLARFHAGLSDARQAIVERGNKMRALLLSSNKNIPNELETVDPIPTISRAVPAVDDVIRNALERHPEYQMRKLMVQREGLQLAYARNQTLPRVDLVASYGINGLALNPQNAFSLGRNGDFPTWTLGVQASMPLGKNRQASADLMAAQARKQDALMSLEGVEATLVNDIHTSAAVIRESLARYDLFEQIANRDAGNLSAQRQRLAAGRIDIRELLYTEERIITSRIAMQEQAVANAKGGALLEMAQGILLEKYK